MMNAQFVKMLWQRMKCPLSHTITAYTRAELVLVTHHQVIAPPTLATKLSDPYAKLNQTNKNERWSQ
jgi:hypothetical protein